jgi:hypothetical protein
VPSVMDPCKAIQPPSASTPTWPSAGIACSAGLYLAISRTVRTREPYSAALAASSLVTSWASWPKPFTTRTPVTAASTTSATAAARCCASQLAGNRVRRDRSEMNHRLGATASATTVSSGESTAMAISEPANSTALPSSIGTMDSRLCTMLMSEIDRLTIWPVCSSSWRVPSRRDSDARISVRRSCCTSRESCPARYRRRYSAPKLISAAPSRASASGQMAVRAVEVRLSTMSRWISGMVMPTALTTRVPARARITLRGYRQQ